MMTCPKSTHTYPKISFSLADLIFNHIHFGSDSSVEGVTISNSTGEGNYVVLFKSRFFDLMLLKDINNIFWAKRPDNTVARLYGTSRMIQIQYYFGFHMGIYLTTFYTKYLTLLHKTSILTNYLRRNYVRL